MWSYLGRVVWECVVVKWFFEGLLAGWNGVGFLRWNKSDNRKGGSGKLWLVVRLALGCRGAGGFLLGWTIVVLRDRRLLAVVSGVRRGGL